MEKAKIALLDAVVVKIEMVNPVEKLDFFNVGGAIDALDHVLISGHAVGPSLAPVKIFQNFVRALSENAASFRVGNIGQAPGEALAHEFSEARLDRRYRRHHKIVHFD